MGSERRNEYRPSVMFPPGHTRLSSAWSDADPLGFTAVNHLISKGCAGPCKAGIIAQSFRSHFFHAIHALIDAFAKTAHAPLEGL
jgi:hypothetical protein